MAYFPLFIELARQSVLIVGGGNMALHKARRLVGYGPRIVVVAPEVLPELAAMPEVAVRRRKFCSDDLFGDYAFVIAATNNDALNRMVSELFRERRVPVNVVDTQEACSFIFPSLVRRGPLSIGISTGGASPAAAVRIKNEIEAALPASTEDILVWLGSLRAYIRGITTGEAQRKRLYQTLLAEALEQDRVLTETETEAIITRFVSPP